MALVFRPLVAITDVDDYLGVTSEPLLPVCCVGSHPLYLLANDELSVVFEIHREHLPFLGAVDTQAAAQPRDSMFRKFANLAMLWLEAQADEQPYITYYNAEHKAKSALPELPQEAPFPAVLDFWRMVTRVTNIRRTYSVKLESDEDEDFKHFLGGKLYLPPQILDAACTAFLALLHALGVDLAWDMAHGLWHSAMIPALPVSVNERLYKPLCIPSVQETKVLKNGKKQLDTVLHLTYFDGFNVAFVKKEFMFLEGAINVERVEFTQQLNNIDRLTRPFRHTLAMLATHDKYSALPAFEKEMLLYASTFQFAAIAQAFLACNKPILLSSQNLISLLDQPEDKRLLCCQKYFMNRMKRDHMHVYDLAFSKAANMATAIPTVAMPCFTYAESNPKYGQVCLSELKNDKPKFLQISYRRYEAAGSVKLMQWCSLSPGREYKAPAEPDAGNLRMVGSLSPYNSTEHTELANYKGSVDGGKLGQHMLTSLYKPNENTKPGVKYTVKNLQVSHGVFAHVVIDKHVLICLLANVLCSTVHASGRAQTVAQGDATLSNIVALTDHFHECLNKHKAFVNLAQIDPKSDKMTCNTNLDCMFDIVNARALVFMNSRGASNQNLNKMPWLYNSAVIAQSNIYQDAKNLLLNVNMREVVEEALAANPSLKYLRVRFVSLQNTPINLDYMISTGIYKMGPMSLTRRMVFFHGVSEASKHDLQCDFSSYSYVVKVEPCSELYTKDMYTQGEYENEDASPMSASKLAQIVNFYLQMGETEVRTSVLNNSCLSEELYEACVAMLEAKNIEVVEDAPRVYAHPCDGVARCDSEDSYSSPAHTPKRAREQPSTSSFKRPRAIVLSDED